MTEQPSPTPREPRHMVLTVFMHLAGYHKDSWRRPGSRAEEFGHLEFVTDLARAAEAAKLDAVFFGDMVATAFLQEGDVKFSGFWEPVSTMGALAACTERIGLIGTISTSFSEPYNVARQLAGIDTLSKGRAGWNIVTSGGGQENFGRDEHWDRPTRYRRAAEYVDVVTKLWDSWSDAAVIADRERGDWMDLDEIHPINHHGEFFKVAGPLNMRRPVQGWPVLAQAGSSESGLDFGAHVADLVYTILPVKERAIEYRRAYREAIAAAGRNPDHVKIVPGILPIVAETQGEADTLAEELIGYVDMDRGRRHLAQMLYLPATGLDDVDLDASIPEARWVTDGSKGSRYDGLRLKSTERGFTLRDLIVDVIRAGGHQWIVGTPDKIADIMIDWYDSGACDGFSLNPPYAPGGFHRIFDLLVPELRRRGYFREEYTGTTLREHLGLPRPSA
ncbi:MAG TPA: NtaA/DmoA family FMN-dependent monooxygenase [Microbacteriaceae bacterium]|nr:NtaA/DmoA family FMN-dependent monooxygenase [Microbacteriaceae bacterium]